MMHRLLPHARHLSGLIGMLLAWPALAAPSLADGAAATPTAVAEAEGVHDGAARGDLREAEQRYSHALQLYDEGAFDAALLELSRAYDLAPSFRLLFNLAIVSLKLNDYAGAMTFFERYLELGGDAVSAEKRGDVTSKLRELSASVAWVHIDVNVPSATILVDDREVGRAPLPAPLRLNAGLRRVSARAPNHVPDSRLLELAGGDRATLALVLVPSAPPPLPVVDTPSRPIPWLAWGATALLTGGAVWSGLNALAAQRDYEDELGQYGTTRQELDDANRTAFRYSLAADVLGIAALGVGGYALYLTLDTPDEPMSSRPSSSNARIELWPGGAHLRGEF